MIRAPAVDCWLTAITGVVVLTATAGCEKLAFGALDPFADPCAGVDCGEHGSCVWHQSDHRIHCSCDDGRVEVGFECMPLAEGDCPAGTRVTLSDEEDGLCGTSRPWK